MFVGPQIVNGSEIFEPSLDVDRIIISNLSRINVALLKLAKPVSYQDYIQPLCIDINKDRSFPVGTPCWVAGWVKESVSTGKVLEHVLNPLLLAKNYSYDHMAFFVDSEGAISGLQDLDTRVASCGNVSDSNYICTNTMNLHLVN